MTFLLVFLLAGLAATAATRAAIPWAASLGIVAGPNADVRTHTRVVPLLGGIGILSGVVPALLWATRAHARWIGLAGGLLVLLPLAVYKDWRPDPVRPAIQAAWQTLGASLLFAFGLRLGFPSNPVADYALTVGLCIWIINGVNFIDVMDGLAGGVAAIGAFFLAGWHARHGNVDATVVALGLGAACLGFLVFNRPPARIFMGDIGSFSVGLCLAALLIAIDGEPRSRLACSLFLFVPLAELAVTSAIRLGRGGRPSAGGPEHLPLRALDRGWPAGRVLAAAYSTSIAAGVVGWIVA